MLHPLHPLYSYICLHLPNTLFSSVWVADAPRKTTTGRRQKTVEYRGPIKRRIGYSRRKMRLVTDNKKEPVGLWING
jgi:hypothetical protein